MTFLRTKNKGDQSNRFSIDVKTGIGPTAAGVTTLTSCRLLSFSVDLSIRSAYTEQVNGQGPNILAPDVQSIDNTVHQINHYPLDGVICLVYTYPLDRDFSGGQLYPPFEQLGPEPSHLGQKRAAQTKVSRAQGSRSLNKEVTGPNEIGLRSNISKTSQKHR